MARRGAASVGGYPYPLPFGSMSTVPRSTTPNFRVQEGLPLPSGLCPFERGPRGRARARGCGRNREIRRFADFGAGTARTFDLHGFVEGGLDPLSLWKFKRRVAVKCRAKDGLAKMASEARFRLYICERVNACMQSMLVARRTAMVWRGFALKDTVDALSLTSRGFRALRSSGS